MNITMDIEKLSELRNKTGYGNETIAEEVASRKAMEIFIKQCRLEFPEEVAELFESYTRLIWQYHCPGMIHKFYCDDTICHGENGKLTVGSVNILRNTLSALRSFPDRRVHFVDIFVEGNEVDGYCFGQATRFILTNSGWSCFGPPTGKTLSRNGEWCHSICELHFKKVLGRWRVVEEWVVDSQEAFEETMTPDSEVNQEAYKYQESEMAAIIANNSNKAINSDLNGRKRNEMISDAYIDAIDELVEAVDGCRFEDIEEVRAFVYNLTKLAYDYKMMGKLYDFYLEDVDYHKQNRVRLKNVVEVVHSVLDICAEFPDLKADVENIIVHKVSDDFYKIFRRLRFKGTNLGHSPIGPPTGKSLEDKCLNLSLMHLKCIDGQWKFVFEVNCDSEGWIREVETM